MARQDRGIVFLAAETAAGDDLDHRHPRVVEAEQPLQRAVHVERALHRSVDGHAAVGPRHRSDGLRLDVHLLLVADAVGALDDAMRAERRGQPFGRLLNPIRLEEVGREQRIEHRRQLLDLHPNVQQRLFQLLAVGAGDERDRLLAVAHDFGSEHRLVVLDEVDDVVARDVRRGDAHDVRPIERRVPDDGADLPVRHLRPHRPPPQLVRKGQVVEVPCAARHLVRAVLARRRPADDPRLLLDVLHGRRIVLERISQPIGNGCKRVAKPSSKVVRTRPLAVAKRLQDIHVHGHVHVHEHAVVARARVT